VLLDPRPPQYMYRPAPRYGRRVARGAAQASWWTVKRGWRYRSRLWPVYAGIVAGLAAEALHIVEDGWRTALVLGVLAGVGAAARQVHQRRAGRAWTRALTAVVWGAWAAVTAWVAVAAKLGPLTIPVPGFAAVGLAIAEASWLWHRRTRPEIVAEIEREQAIDRRVELWMQYGYPSNGAIPGSYLACMDDLDNDLGWSATITMDADTPYTTEHAIAATQRISKIYGVPVNQVIVEAPISGLAGEARLLVLRRNPLVDVQLFDGPTLDRSTGFITIGRHAGGELARWRLWTPGSGVNHGLIAGTTGAGKSGLLNVLCAEIRHSGVGVLCLADPEDGESVPDWAVHGPHVFAGTIPKIRRMLQAVERIGDARKRRRARTVWKDEQGRQRRGRGYFDPTPEEPAYWVVIDEAPTVLADPECARIIAKIGKKFRKYGIGCILSVQVPSLAELGGDLTIRSMMSSTNICIFRTSDRLSAQMGAPSDLPVDPVNLPVTWPDGSTTAGLGYLPVVGGLISTMRARMVEDPYAWATSGNPVKIPAEEIEDAADEKGNYFLDWQALRDVDDDDEDEPDWTPTSPQAAQALHERRGRADKLKDKVLALLAQRGPTLLGTIASEVNAPKPTTSMCLSRLRAAGKVHQPQGRHGYWALGPAPELVEEQQELQGVN
jgi:hypothetical protein